MGAAAAELFVRVSADVADFQKKMSAAGADAARGMSEVASAAAKVSPIDGILESLNRKMEATAHQAEAFGAEFNDAAQRAALLKKAVIDLTEQGLTLQDERLAQVTAEWKRWESVAHGSTTSVGQAVVTFGANLAANLVADALQAAGAAMLDAGKRALSLAGELEQSKVAFTTMLGSAGKADAFLKELTAFAANTPFELRGLQDSSKKLLAFGFQAKDVIPIMTSVGNAVAGLGGGKDVLDGVTMALGQMQAKGKASAEEMGQLAERGIPAWQFLADKIGKSIPEAMKLAQDGAISGSTAIQAVIEGMNKKFPDMMAKQSQTLVGAWSNATDAVDGLLTRLGTSFVTNLDVTGLIQGATEALNRMNSVLDSGALASALEVIEAGAIGAATAATAYLVPAYGTQAVAAMVAFGRSTAAAFATATMAAAPYIAIAAAVAFAAYPIVKNWDDLQMMFGDIWQQIAEGAGRMWQSIRQTWAWMTEGATSVARSISSWFSSVFGSLPEQWRVNIKAATGVVATLPGAVGSTLQNLEKSVLGEGYSVFGNMKETWGSALSDARKVADTMLNGIAGTSESAMKDLALHLAGGNAALDAHGKKHKAAATEAEKAAKRLADAYADVPKILSGIQLEGSTRGDGALVVMGKSVDFLQKRLHDLIEKGADPADARFKDFMRTVQGMTSYLEHLQAGAHDTAAQLAAIGSAGKGIGAASALAGLSGQLKTIAADAVAIGSGFDAAGKRAAALATTLEALGKAGFSKNAALVKDLTAQMNSAVAISKRWQDAQKDVGQVFDQLNNGLAENERRAEIFGEAFDKGAADVAVFQRALDAAIGSGKFTAEALQYLKDRLDATKAALPPAAVTVDTLRTALGALQTNVSNITTGLGGMATALGVDLQDPLSGAIANTLNLGMAFVSVVDGISKLPEMVGNAVGAINGLLGPWGLVAAAVGVVIGGLVALSKQSDKSTRKIDSDLDAVARSMTGTGNVILDLWYGVGQTLLSIGEAVRSAWDWIMGPSDAYKQARAQLEKLQKEHQAYVLSFNTFRDDFVSSFNSAGQSAMKAFLDGTAGARQALRDGIRDAITSGIVDAMIKKGVIEKAFANDIGALSGVLASVVEGKADISAADQWIASIGAKIPKVAATLEGVLGPLKTSLDSAFGGTSQLDQIMDTLLKAREATGFKANTLHSIDAAAALTENISATEAAMTSLNEAGLQATSQFAQLAAYLADARKEAERLKNLPNLAGAYAPAIASQQKELEKLLNAGKGPGSADYDRILGSLTAMQAELRVPALAAGGVTTDATLALIGEGRHKEAVLPLSPETFAQIGKGVADAGGAQVQRPVIVNISVSYTGSGRLTRDEIEDAGEVLVDIIKSRIGRY